MARYCVRRAIGHLKDAEFQFLNYSPGTLGWVKGELSQKYAHVWYSLSETLGKWSGECSIDDSSLS